MPVDSECRQAKSLPVIQSLCLECETICCIVAVRCEVRTGVYCLVIGDVRV